MHGAMLRRSSRPVDARGMSMPDEGLCLTLLGPPQIMLDGTPLAIRRRKAQALLIYLAAMGGPQPREVLASLLAGTAIDDLARKHLRTALSELSNQIGDYLLITRHSIALNRALPHWLDVEQFTAMLDTDDPAVLERAVGMYEDAFLTGFALRDAPRFEAWMLQEQEHLHALLVQALHRLLDQALQCGDVVRAIAFAHRLIDEEPWCEETHRQLMWLFARTGRRSEALDQYAICRRIVTQNLNSELQPETEALYERLRGSATPVPHNLPALSSPIIGRERELVTLLRQLADPDCRLITLLGLGGSGKTHLALEAAHQLTATESVVEHPFTDGVYLVDLSALQPHRHGQGDGTVAASSLAKAIGRTLGIHFASSTDPTTQLLAHLRARSLLLILDGCELLLDGTTVLSRMLQQAPGVQFLATSRARLGLAEERIVTLGGLALPSSTEDLEEAAASRLFLRQAQHVRLNKPLSAADRAHIVRICRLVHGLPLALVLAANWLSGLSCAGIATELAGGIDLLTATDYAVPERQRSLRAILDALWKELPVTERAVLRQLAVIQGSFTAEAAQAVAGRSSTPHVLDESMVLDHDERDRYTMHGLVRLYAVEQLASRPEERARARTRHAIYYAAQVQQHVPTVGAIPCAREALGEDIDNVRVAWDWAIAQGAVDLLDQMRVGLAQWYYQKDLFDDWIAAVGQAAVQVRATLAGDGTPDATLQQLLGYLLFCEAEACIWQGHDGPARALLEEVRTLARATSMLRLEAHGVYYLAWLLHRQGKAGARILAEQALGMARVARAPDLEAHSLCLLGACTIDLGDYPQAQRYLGRALPTFAVREDHLGATAVEFQQGIVAYEQGDFATARAYVENSLNFWRAQKNHPGEQVALYYLGLLCDAELGRHLEAEACLAQAVSLAQLLGDAHLASMARVGQGQNALLQGDFQRAQAAFEHALYACQQIDSQAVTAQALRGLGLRAHYLGDDWQARELAQQALRIAQETGQRRAARFAQRLLGRALLGLGAPTDAAVAYQQALELDQGLGYPHLALEVAADLASVAAAQGDLDQATAYVDPILAELEHHTLLGVEEPVRVYLTCYHVLKAMHDPRAEAVLAAGYDLLQQRAAQFADEVTRSRFVENLPAHREITRLAHGLLEPAAIGLSTSIAVCSSHA